jgi:hypothetical protein
MQIASTKVHTKRGYEAKCRAIAEADFDDDDLVVLGFLLGRDAQRLEIAGVPDCITRRRILESFRRHAELQASRDSYFVNTYADSHRRRALIAPPVKYLLSKEISSP